MTILNKNLFMLLSAVVISGGLCACSDDSDGTKTGNGEQLPIQLSYSLAGATGMRSTTEPHLMTQGDNQVLAAGLNVDLFLDEEPAPGNTASYTGGLYYLKSTAPSGTGALGVGNLTFYSDQARTATITRYWPASGSKLHFFAWYPSQVVTAPVTRYDADSPLAAQTFAVAADQSSANGSVNSDLMFGVPNGNPIGTAASNPVERPMATTLSGAPSVNLNFTHCLSKVVIVLQGDGNGIGNGTAGGPATGDDAHKNGFDQYGRDQFTEAVITLGTTTDKMYQIANFIPNTGVATAKTDGNTCVITIKSSSLTSPSFSYFGIIPPQQLTGKKVSITLKDGGTKVFTIPQLWTDANNDGIRDAGELTNAVAEGGKVYTYTVKVGLYAITNITATVTDWTPSVMDEGTLKY